MKLSRFLFAFFTIVILGVTFYLPLMGLGYALDTSATLQSRGEGLLFVLPSVALLCFLGGLLPFFRAWPLWCLGFFASGILLVPAVACPRSGILAAIGSFCAITYAGIWWFLVRSKLTRPASRVTSSSAS